MILHFKNITLLSKYTHIMRVLHSKIEMFAVMFSLFLRKDFFVFFFRRSERDIRVYRKTFIGFYLKYKFK